MNKEEKWKAIIENDSRYDGKFFYGVKTTKIFCRPSCKSKNPVKENVKFFLLLKLHLKVDLGLVKDVDLI